MTEGRIAVVSHDAGGAEILSSWLRRYDGPYSLALDGPAAGVFQRKLGNCSVVSLTEAIEESDWVLCGTSWQSSLERQAIMQAKSAGKHSVAFLDHWVNYSERFLEQGDMVLPDEIWVGDEHAQKIAQTHFPDLPINLQTNPYFEDIKLEFESISQIKQDAASFTVLYVCEPVREFALYKYGDERFFGYTEEDALLFFLENIQVLGSPEPVINLRLHPTEAKGKYDQIKNSSPLNIRVSSGKTLFEEIAEADVVVGCASMALVVALLAKKRVISSIPSGGRPCVLPFSEIEHMPILVTDYRNSADG
ncbi:hypothetical protein [Chlorobium ferrooxidans]|uniref:Uncharacterized protein n=1 Tax=Chlorobium ferrooxidans DSM 13031 TaxID=377431 RepID=Q0YTT2_9CHLB|nr:hypothetical protein [Chlorobium ferrooxidans]EAT59819.1 hypothetical protein CferDRAFT_1826 [Chlorobium ferrooxidans DSM 13031]